MPSSVREQILTATIALLNGATSVGTNVFRERETPISRDITPAIVIQPEEEVDSLVGQNVNESTLTINICIYTRGDPFDSIADPIATVMHNLVMTSSVLLGLCHQIKKVSSKWETHEADQTAGVLTMAYTFRYAHYINDITKRF